MRFNLTIAIIEDIEATPELYPQDRSELSERIWSLRSRAIRMLTTLARAEI